MHGARLSCREITSSVSEVSPVRHGENKTGSVTQQLTPDLTTTKTEERARSTGTETDRERERERERNTIIRIQIRIRIGFIMRRALRRHGN